MRMQPLAQETGGQLFARWGQMTLSCIVILGALWLAWRNYRAGRGDRRGALRLAAFGLVVQTLAGVVLIHHVPAQTEIGHLMDAAGFGLFVAAVAWVLYMALEPYLRRSWPQSLISWTRLLSGDTRDPLVAGHILIGTALGVGTAVLSRLEAWLEWQRTGILFLNSNTVSALSGGVLTGWILEALFQAPSVSLGVFFAFFLFRALLRNTWAAVAVVVALISSIVGAETSGAPLATVAAAITLAVGVWGILRFGILSFTVLFWVLGLISFGPLTSDFSAWYADRGLILIGLVLALAVWSFRNALGGRKVFEDDFP
jgi:hypothetical protein